MARSFSRRNYAPVFRPKARALSAPKPSSPPTQIGARDLNKGRARPPGAPIKIDNYPAAHLVATYELRKSFAISQPALGASSPQIDLTRRDERRDDCANLGGILMRKKRIKISGAGAVVALLAVGVAIVVVLIIVDVTRKPPAAPPDTCSLVHHII